MDLQIKVSIKDCFECKNIYMICQADFAVQTNFPGTHTICGGLNIWTNAKTQNVPHDRIWDMHHNRSHKGTKAETQDKSWDKTNMSTLI